MAKASAAAYFNALKWWEETKINIELTFVVVLNKIVRFAMAKKTEICVQMPSYGCRRLRDQKVCGCIVHIWWASHISPRDLGKAWGRTRAFYRRRGQADMQEIQLSR